MKRDLSPERDDLSGAFWSKLRDRGIRLDNKSREGEKADRLAVKRISGDTMAADHYATLEKHASDCISCGHCDKRCPFHAVQTGRMKEIAAYFGK